MAQFDLRYEELSTLMGTNPELAIFRRFGAFNLRNILSLQAEISYIDHELGDLTAEDLSTARAPPTFMTDRNLPGWESSWLA